MKSGAWLDDTQWINQTHLLVTIILLLLIIYLFTGCVNEWCRKQTSANCFYFIIFIIIILFHQHNLKVLACICFQTFIYKIIRSTFKSSRIKSNERAAGLQPTEFLRTLTLKVLEEFTQCSDTNLRRTTGIEIELHRSEKQTFLAAVWWSVEASYFRIWRF